jgi:hypothetical protein
MAATVLIREANGAGPTYTDKTSGTIRFRNSDAATVDNNNPLVVPTANTEYSFRKVLQLHISAGTFTEVSNPNFYLDGANNFGTGRKLWMNNTAQGTYTQGTKPAVTNDPPQFPGATPMIDAFGATAGAPKDLDAVNAGPFNSAGLPKNIGDFLNLVAELEIGSTQGVWPGETGTFSFDEI